MVNSEADTAVRPQNEQTPPPSTCLDWSDLLSSSSWSQMASSSRFTRQDVHNFSFSSSYCLENPRCYAEFEEFLKKTRRSSYIPPLKLFNKASNATEYKEEEFSDLIDQIDDFNTHELERHRSDVQKLNCIKIQCSSIIDKGVYKLFIPFLKDEKMKTKP